MINTFETFCVILMVHVPDKVVLLEQLVRRVLEVAESLGGAAIAHLALRRATRRRKQNGISGIRLPNDIYFRPGGCRSLMKSNCSSMLIISLCLTKRLQPN